VNDNLLSTQSQILELFALQGLGFHSDFGPEYVNEQVADLQEMLLIEFAKSRHDTQMTECNTPSARIRNA
jgi:hypothetical protein